MPARNGFRPQKKGASIIDEPAMLVELVSFIPDLREPDDVPLEDELVSRPVVPEPVALVLLV